MVKKGLFFSLISVTIIILIGLSAELITKSDIRESEIEVTRTRVRLLNSMISDLQEVYFDRLIFVASKNALKGLSHYYSTNNFDPSIINNQLWKALDTVIHQGTLSGVDLTKTGCGGPCMENSHTLENLLKRVTEQYDYIGIEIDDFTLDIREVNQLDPFTLEVVAEIKFDFRDKSGMAGWKGFATRKVNIDVLGLYYDSRVINNNWHADCSATSILDRLEGRTGASAYCFGISP